jgi:5-methylcytosine-specific restriction protein A
MAGLNVCSHREPRCSRLTSGAYCEEHQPEARRHERRHYTGIPGVNYGRRWGRERKRYLADHPWCVDCEQAGTRTLATDLDHIVPHEGDYELFWDERNWQGLCEVHHGAKTAREVARSRSRGGV